MSYKNITHWKNLSLDNLTEVFEGKLYKEKWKPIKGWEGLYQISTFGRVKSLKRTVLRKPTGVCPFTHCLTFPTRILKQNNLQTGGYCSVKLCTNSNHINAKVHRLVATAFIPNPKNKPGVNHNFCVKTDNRVIALEWHTQSENVTHSFFNGIHTVGIFGEFGAKNPKSKPVTQYTKDGKLVKTHPGQQEASRKTGVDQASIWRCCNKRSLSAGGFVWRYARGYRLGTRGATKGNKKYSTQISKL